MEQDFFYTDTRNEETVEANSPLALELIARTALEEEGGLSAIAIAGHVNKCVGVKITHVLELFERLQPFVAEELSRRGIEAHWESLNGRWRLVANAKIETWSYPPAVFVKWRADTAEIGMKRLMWRTAQSGVPIQSLLEWMDIDSLTEPQGELLRLIEDMEKLQFLQIEPNGEGATVRLADDYCDLGNHGQREACRIARAGVAMVS